ncbi:MAG: metallophosphoesterase [Nanoarchaeota archaeon]|nr:metallophosphoesterase [Nanoarchaeota archaeon]
MKRTNKIRKVNALVALFLVMITVTMPCSSALFDWSEEAREEDTGESILVEVAGYEPEILPSSLIEDGDVPVYVYLTGLTPGRILGTDANAEPIYGNVKIKNLFTRPLDQETLDYVRGSPKYIEPRQYSLENLGYIVVTLKQIDREADVPEEISLNMKAEITFENADRLYSMIEQDLVVPESPDESAWRQNPEFNEYRFFGGRGAIRASSISDNSAELTVYGGQDLQWPFTGTPRPLQDVSLDKGETSGVIRMSAASDFMTNAFRVKLTDITDPSQKRAKIRVNINGEEREYIVTEGSRLYPGSSLIVKEINVVRRGPNGQLVTYEIVVKGPRDQSTASKSFVARAGEAIAGLVGYVSDDAAEAITEATRDEYQAGVSSATTALPGTGESGSFAGASSSVSGTLGASSSSVSGTSSSTTSSAKANFIVMSDMHTTPDGGKPYREAAVAAVKRIKPEFVVMTGDIVNGDAGTTAADAKKMWDLFESETRAQLSAAGITVIPVAGNHDMNNLALRTAYKTYWNTHKPAVSINANGNYPLYYSFDKGTNHFVVLEGWYAQINEEQRNWMRTDLSQANAAGKTIIVFSHLPVEAIEKRSVGQASGSPSSELQPNSEIKSILTENGVDAFIHGDVHGFYEGTTSGINVISAGPLGGANRYVPGSTTATPRMIVPVEVEGSKVVSYGLVYPGFTTRFDESVFTRANVRGYSVWNQGEPSASVPVASVSQESAATTGDEKCTSEGGVCIDTRKDMCFEEAQLLTSTYVISNKCLSKTTAEQQWYKCCETGFVKTGESARFEEFDCTSAGGKCEDSSKFKCLNAQGTATASWVSGKCSTLDDRNRKCCPTGNVNVDLYPCAVDGHCKERCDRQGEYTLARGETTCDIIKPGTMCCMGTDDECTNAGGVCEDSRKFDCLNTEGTAEAGWVSGLCISRPDSWYKCCAAGEDAIVAMAAEAIEIEGLPAVQANTDLACTSAGGVCKDKRENNCYADASQELRAGWTTGKCMLKPDDLNYACCASGVTGPKAETTAAGEGICAGKVILLRESDTAEQWNETISKATQEQIYCTAAEEFKRIAGLYPGLKDEEGAFYEDKAYYMLGEIYYWLGDSATGLKYYKMAVRNSIGRFIPLAQARIDELEEEARLHTTYSMSEFEENGILIRVKLLDVLWQEETDRPKATIEVEEETGTRTKKLEIDNDVFGADFTYTGSDRIARKYNWKIVQINSESVVIEKHFREGLPPDYRAERRYLPIRETARVEDRGLRLKSVDLKKFAIVTIIPGTGAPLKSETNFTVHIPIEKRAISLTPDEISSQINSTQEIIEDLNEVIDTLNDVVVTWKKVCLGTFLFLTLKNSFFTGMARTQARRLSMHGIDGKSGWDQYCRSNSGDGRLYDDYEECIIENTDNIEATTDAAQDAVETVNEEMEDYRNQGWYREIASDYPEIGKYGEYVDDELFNPQQLRDYRYWQLMRESSAYGQLSGERQESGYEYNLRKEVDENLASFNLGNEDKTKAYADAVGDINANYANFDSLSDQDREILFNDLYGAHLATPDTRSNDFPYVESLGVTPLATIRREGRELYSNTPNGRVTLREASIQDYDKRLTDGISGFTEGSAERATIQNEMARIEDLMEGNAFMPLRTNQGQVYADDTGRFYVAMTAAYATERTRNDYDPAASAEFYPDGKPYCVPTGQGNFVKVLDFYREGSPSIVQEWNVGDDGFLCTDDDVMIRHQSMLERPEQESSHRSLVETATRVGARREGEVISAAGRQFAVSTSRSSADNSRSQPNCYDTMDPDDCRLLFGVCDPVMCPPSRFNLGGTWQVNDVVQTGLIGSVVLGLPNFDIPYEPVPICLTGVLAGLQNIKSVLRGYVECLKTAEINGHSVGICDKIRSVFICELLWKEAIAILNIKGGLFKWISQTFMGQEQGGGEYLTFESSLQNVEDSFSFFTTQYATTAFASYQSRSMEELGTSICKQAIFGKLPALGEFFDQLAQPESPPQYTALVTEFEYSETMQQSRYETFYHIYAGEDNDATYSVFLKNSITGDTFYVTERCYGRQGSITSGGIASFNIDCPETKGYDQVCITLNGNTQCGFGKVSTSFALNYLTDMIVADEAMRQIDSEEECYPSSPVTSPSLGSLPLPGNIEVLSSGIQRVCSMQNPGSGTNPLDWKEVGTCGKDSTGRLLGSCWLDMRTVSIHDTERMGRVTSALEEAGLRERKEELGISDLLEEEDSVKELERIKGLEKETCMQKTEAMKLYRELEIRTIVPRVGAEAGSMYSQLMYEAAGKCARYDLKREVEKLASRFEYDVAGIHAEYSMRMQDEVIGRYRGTELTSRKAALTQEFQVKVQEAYMKAQEKLTGLTGMDYPENIAKYGAALDETYSMYYNLRVPFIVEDEREESASDARAMELRCNSCGGTLYDTNRCDPEECYSLGTCYFKEGSLTNVFSSESMTNECHACGMAQTCDVFNVDKKKCVNEQCMSAAGLTCGIQYDRCVAVERAAESESIGMAAGGSVLFTTAAAPTSNNIVDFGEYVTLNSRSAADRATMQGIIAMPRPSSVPAGPPTYSKIAASRYYTADCAEYNDGANWYSGWYNNAEQILAENPKECTTLTTRAGIVSPECIDVPGDKRACRTIGDKKVCWWGACQIPFDHRGFYEDTLCEGSGVCGNLVYAADSIGKTPGVGGVTKTSANEHGYTKMGVKPEVKRTIAVTSDAGTSCYIPYGSLMYIKFSEGNPLNGWYYAEDTGGGFKQGRCLIDMYAGMGHSGLQVFDRMNSASGTDKWRADIWVYPPRAVEGVSETPGQGETPDTDDQFCRTCGDGLLENCDTNECHGKGPCYFKPSVASVPSGVPLIGGVGIRNPFTSTDCYGCAKATSCADFSRDSAMCNAAGCTGRAGLLCEWKDNACKEKSIEAGAAASAEETTAAAARCASCGDGVFDNLCDAEECRGLALGSCYFVKGRSSLPLIGSISTGINDCYACANAGSCSDFNDDSAMCNLGACTSKAGLSCEWKDNSCKEKQSAVIESPQGMCTSNSRCASCRGVGYNSPKKVGVIGDSLTNGTNSYVCYLNKQCDSSYDFYNYGVNGDTTYKMSARFSGDILNHGFDEVIIMGGINNGNSATAIENDLQDMYTQAKQAGMRVIALTITPYKGHGGTYPWDAIKQARNDEVNRWIMNEAVDVDVRVNTYSALEGAPDMLKAEYAASDKLHLTPTGQNALGAAVFAAAYSRCTG